MKVKAIMCDVDGTLLTSKGVVSPLTIQAIQKAREKGILFGLSTGRDVHSVKTLLKEWGIDGLVDSIVGTGGAEICDFTFHVETQSFPLDGHLIKEIVKHYEDMDVNFAIPYNGIFYTPKDDEHIQHLSTADKVPYKVVNYDEFLSEPRPKLIIICHPGDMDKVIERSQTFQNDQYKSASLITASILYEYQDPRVSKTHGLKQVMDMHGIDMKYLCTFGDADNDYDMTLNAGIGVVMANGSEKTKSVADYITDDHDHDGIGNFINRYILNEEVTNRNEN
jgi:HAD-superfamily hydrolase, subfamily IIB